MLVRIGNKEDPDQTASDLIRLLFQKQSDLGLLCLFRPFWQASGFQNFTTSTVLYFLIINIQAERPKQTV